MDSHTEELQEGRRARDAKLKGMANEQRELDKARAIMKDGMVPIDQVHELQRRLADEVQDLVVSQTVLALWGPSGY